MFSTTKFSMHSAMLVMAMTPTYALKTTGTYHLQYTSDTYNTVRHVACLDALAGPGLASNVAMERGGSIIEGMSFHFTASALGGEYGCGTCLKVTGAIGTVFVTVVDIGGNMLDLTSTMYEQTIGPLSGPGDIDVEVVDASNCPGNPNGGSASPVQPTVPVQPPKQIPSPPPVDPVVPQDPIAPVDPFVPVDPIAPVDPVYPVDPAQPVDIQAPVDDIFADPSAPIPDFGTFGGSDPSTLPFDDTFTPDIPLGGPSFPDPMDDFSVGSFDDVLPDTFDDFGGAPVDPVSSAPSFDPAFDPSFPIDDISANPTIPNTFDSFTDVGSFDPSVPQDVFSAITSKDTPSARRLKINVDVNLKPCNKQ